MNSFTKHYWTVYTDGSCILQTGSMSGGWRLVNTGTGQVITGTQHFGTGTNNEAEILAIREALKAVPTNPEETSVHVLTDSQWCINSLNGDNKIKKHATHFRDVWQMMVRFNAVKFEHVKAHNGAAGNEHADKLAKAGHKKPSQHATVALANVSDGLGTFTEVIGVGSTREGAQRDSRTLAANFKGIARFTLSEVVS